MNQKSFEAYQAHLEGQRIILSSSQKHTASIGSDNCIYKMYMESKTGASQQLQNKQLQITAFAVHPKIQNCYLIGTKNGFVKYLKPINKMNLDFSQTIYKSDKEIKSLAFNHSGELIAISVDQQRGIVYSIKDRQIFDLKEPHEGYITNIFFGNNYVFSIGGQGYLHLYKIQSPQKMPGQSDQQYQSEDLFKQKSTLSLIFMDKYKIVEESLIKKFKFLNAIFIQLSDYINRQKIILVSGQTSPHMLTLNNDKSSYKLITDIIQHQEILMMQQLTSNDNLTKFIVTSTQKSLSIWNFTKKQKIWNISTLQIFEGIITQLVNIKYPDHQTFMLVINNQKSNGKIYIFNNIAVFNTQITQNQQQKGQKLNDAMNNEFQSRWQSKPSKMLPHYAQFELDKKFEQYENAKFLFYNNIGCIIQIKENNSQALIELDLHDKGKLSKLKLQANNRPFQHFALKQKVLVYATSTLIIFQQEKQINQGEGPWEVRWEDIKGVTIGGNWIAAYNQEEIRIFDYKGHDMHCISFDRLSITFEAYEDMLAIVYHGALPLFGCQALKMRIYKITQQLVTLQKDVNIPIKPNSHLKWFGFSQQGQIYCQDTLEVIRCYDYDRNQWYIVYSLEETPFRFYIQHIQGEDIYGFRLQQKQGQKIQPRVLPRTLPRKHNLQLKYQSISFLSTQQNSYLKKIILKNILINHEQFRYLRWYKYKYSRNKNHSWFKYSKSIKSQSQIKTCRTQIDFQLIDYLKKFVEKNRDQLTVQFQVIAKSLLLIVQKWANFEQTKQVAKKILITSQNIKLSKQFESLAFPTYQNQKKICTKLDQVNYLQKMLAIMEKCL